MGNNHTAPPSEQVVEAIAVLDDCDPCDVNFQLHDHFDPEAFDALIESVEQDLVIELKIKGYRVVWASDDVVASPVSACR